MNVVYELMLYFNSGARALQCDGTEWEKERVPMAGKSVGNAIESQSTHPHPTAHCDPVAGPWWGAIN